MYETDHLAFSLVFAADEPSDPRPDRRSLVDELQAAGILPRHQLHLRAAVDDGGVLANFFVPMMQVAVPALAGVLVGWLQGRAGRKVRLRIGDIEVEAQTAADVEALLEKVGAFQAEKQSAPGAERHEPTRPTAFSPPD